MYMWAETVWSEPGDYIFDNSQVTIPFFLEAKMPTIDDVTANEIRSQSLQGFTQFREELISSHRFVSDLLKTEAIKSSRELDAVESRSNERLLNAPPIPSVG